MWRRRIGRTGVGSLAPGQFTEDCRADSGSDASGNEGARADTAGDAITPHFFNLIDGKFRYRLPANAAERAGDRTAPWEMGDPCGEDSLPAGARIGAPISRRRFFW